MEIQLIHDKVMRNDFKLTKDEERIVVDCFFKISKIATGKGKVLNIGCKGCFFTAYTVIQNYIKYHWKNDEPKAVVEVKRLDTVNRTRQEMKDILTLKGIKFNHNASNTKLTELINDNIN